MPSWPLLGLLENVCKPSNCLTAFEANRKETHKKPKKNVRSGLVIPFWRVMSICIDELKAVLLDELRACFHWLKNCAGNRRERTHHIIRNAFQVILEGRFAPRNELVFDIFNRMNCAAWGVIQTGRSEFFRIVFAPAMIFEIGSEGDEFGSRFSWRCL